MKRIPFYALDHIIRKRQKGEARWESLLLMEPQFTRSMKHASDKGKFQRSVMCSTSSTRNGKTKARKETKRAGDLIRRRTGKEKQAGTQPVFYVKCDQQSPPPQPPPHPPQHKRSRMIRKQLSFPPQPEPPKPEPPLPQQQHNKRMIQIMELQLLSLHPQFVAAKSLISDLQIFILQYRVCDF